MKIAKSKTNRIKSYNKNLLTFLLSVLFTLNISAKINIAGDTLNDNLSTEKHKLEKQLFTNEEDSNTENLEINGIEVVELEEDVELDFDTSIYLPNSFNALKGKNDLDWNTIELTEIEEEVELDFDTSIYLPTSFNALKGKNDLDWNTIALIEIEEEVELGFDTSKYLPENFNALEGKNDLDWSTIELIEIEEGIEINFDTKAYLPYDFNPYKSMIKNTVIVVIN